MKPRILILGATGKLGIKLLNYCLKNNIKIYGATCYSRIEKLKIYKSKFNINKIFKLSDQYSRQKFTSLILSESFDIIYFLDHGSESLYYLNHILLSQKNTYIAIANKELIVAGGRVLIRKIKKTNNYLIPLDSEHFSLYHSNTNNSEIKNLLITASGGPFYYNKNIKLSNVQKKQVLSHPKWQMGVNNLIDSSNFINKVLELFEVSYIYDIDINKISFVVSPEAYLHSFIIYKNSLISYNCFNNNMLVTLSYPLSLFYKLPSLYKNIYYKNYKKIFFEDFNDSRFIIPNKLKFIKKFNHYHQLQFLLLNNEAQKKYINNELKYIDIPNFILKKIDFKNKKYKLNSINQILKTIKLLKNQYANI